MQDNFPRKLYRAEQVRELDRIAIEKCGIEGFSLMHKAASVGFDVLLEQWPHARHILVFVGPGNNGGDGYVLAGLAKDHGLNAELIQLGDHSALKGDAKLAQEFAAKRQVPCSPYTTAISQHEHGFPEDHTVVVDGLLGTGLSRSVSTEFASAIDCINALRLPVLAIDIPSGICSDTGASLGASVNADFTTTFIGLKRGLFTSDGVEAAGKLVYHSLGVPDEVFNGPDSPIADCYRIDMNLMSRLLLPRPASAHKGQFGHVVVVGGDLGFGGAAIMAAEASVRVGSGLVSLITRSVNRSAALTRRPELMVLGTEDTPQNTDRVKELLGRASVIVVGPGLGKSSWSRELFQMCLQIQKAESIPLVVDADGLNLLSERREQVSGLKRNNWILTPHPGEAARLTESSTAQIHANRFESIVSLQKTWGGACLLKGAGSLLCSGAESSPKIELSSVGNPGMASGGMGDVLSGLVGGLVAQGYSLSDSLRIAVCVHGASADLAAQNFGQRGLAATDLFPFVQQLINPER